MNFIKIDHENLDYLPSNENILLLHFLDNPICSKYEIGYLDCEFQGPNLSDIKRYARLRDSGEIVSIEKVIEYAIIEEPKNRKYESIDDFWKYSGFYPSGSEEDNGLFMIKIYLNSYDSKEFSGASFTECEEKLLDWANDELD
jgi:hypothetical protein